MEHASRHFTLSYADRSAIMVGQIVAAKREVAVPAYVMLANWTDQGARQVKDSPKRVDLARKALIEMGGEFLDQELLDGKDIFVRNTYSNITKDGAIFEQAFSPDGGKTWEKNWVIAFAREK